MKKKISGKTIFNVSVILISLVMLGYFCLSENGLVELSKLQKPGQRLADYGLAQPGS